MAKPKIIHVKTDGAAIVDRALEYAIQRGMNRHDKYSEEPLSAASRNLLAREIVDSFSVALLDMNAEIR